MLIGAGSAAWLAGIADDGYLVRANALVGVAALVVLCAGLVLRVSAVVPVAVALLGLEYLAILVFESEALDTRAPLVAAALLAVSELSYWSLELRSGLADEPGTYLRHLSLLAALAVVTVALGTSVLALVDLVGARGIAIEILGALAAVGVIGLLALAASRLTVP